MEFKLFNVHGFAGGKQVSNNDILDQEKKMLEEFKASPEKKFSTWQSGNTAIIILRTHIVPSVDVIRVFICNNGYSIKEYEQK